MVLTSCFFQFPKLAWIDLSTTGLEYIDPKIADLLINVPDLTVNIYQSIHLKCENLAWMSKVECPQRMIIDGSKCADKNDQPLDQYLKSIDPDSKCHNSHETEARLSRFKENLVFIC